MSCDRLSQTPDALAARLYAAYRGFMASLEQHLSSRRPAEGERRSIMAEQVRYRLKKHKDSRCLSASI
jgi:hypothetical protein